MASDDPYWWYLENSDVLHIREGCPTLHGSDPNPATTAFEAGSTRRLCAVCRQGGTQPYVAAERYVCRALPLELEHVSDQSLAAPDAHLDGDPVEIKTCQYRINDNGSSNGRMGRYKLTRHQHQTLVEDGGYYLFCVFKDGRIHEWELMLAIDVDVDVDDRWTTGTHGADQEVRIRWNDLQSVQEAAA